MGAFGDSKPTVALFGLQFSYAIVSLITRAALIHGMSPRVFVVYRQAIATLVIVPVSYFSRYFLYSLNCYVSLYTYTLIRNVILS
jgi:hypothetical protein